MDESKLDASRIEVLKKIKQYEAEGGESFFKDVENENKEYELILDEDVSNMYRLLGIKNILTGEKTQLTDEVG